MKTKRCFSFLAIGLLWLATEASAEEHGSKRASGSDSEAQSESSVEAREPRRFNVSFMYGSTTFFDSDPHRTLGVTARIRLTDRLSIVPELRYMDLPVSSFEGSRGRRVSRHSDILVAGYVAYDFLDEAETRFVPYVMGGVGQVQTRNETTYTPIAVESAIPVFPTPSPAEATTSKTTTNWLWVGSCVGLRIVLARGFFVSPEVQFGLGQAGDRTTSMIVKMGYGF